MGDFLLDCRPFACRQVGPAAAFLKFYPDMHWAVFHRTHFSLVWTSADSPRLWGPFEAPDGSALVALCGRISLDPTQWEAANHLDGEGGLACKYLHQLYLEGGIKRLEQLSGNFVILLFDSTSSKLHLITDRWGLFPAFRFQSADHDLVYSSHPDALADATGQAQNWDLTSLAEFILTGRLTYPFTYYQTIRSLPVASTTTITWPEPLVVSDATHPYFYGIPDPQPEAKVDTLAESLMEAFRQAVSHRTLPLLGKTAIALSGGLDSRVLLCAAPQPPSLVAFTCYDRENREFRIAKSIAQEMNVAFLPLKRLPDYYGNQAALGVRISGGMGCIASNHFLGIRQELRDQGIDNLITGCYCDYIFKGLAINKTVSRWTSRERLQPFRMAYYSRHFRSPTKLARLVSERLERIFPTTLQQNTSELGVLQVERRRVFPLSYEEDNAQRLIPQRVMGWYVPIAENRVLDIFNQMSCAMKLNRHLFVRVAQRICGKQVATIADANTGAPINAPEFVQILYAFFRRLEQVTNTLRHIPADNGSWPDWRVYPKQSQRMKALWEAPNPVATEIFRLVLGKSYKTDLMAYGRRDSAVFLQLFTLKVWLDERVK